MMSLRGTLLTDGPSDRVLLHTIRWVLKELGVTVTELRWADPRLFPKHADNLTSRALAALDQEPCDILFVHRDAEKAGLLTRAQEIRMALNGHLGKAPYVSIMPVRMTEAWFLFQEEAIRQAAGHPAGKQPLNLPKMNTVESQVNPKSILEEALCKATSHKGRHLKRFKRELRQAKHRVAELIGDFTPLRQLPAFQAFENEVKALLAQMTCNATSPACTSPT